MAVVTPETHTMALPATLEKVRRPAGSHGGHAASPRGPYGEPAQSGGEFGSFDIDTVDETRHT